MAALQFAAMVNHTDSQGAGASSSYSHEEGALGGLNPQTKLPERVPVPGSKSLGIRALLCAGLARGVTEIAGLPSGEDLGACFGVLESVGVPVETLEPGRVRVTGISPAEGGAWSADGSGVQCGQSGTLARFVTAVLALCGAPGSRALVHVQGSLRGRSSDALFDALFQAGVRLEQPDGNGAWPVQLHPVAPPEMVMLQGAASSQELSGLLLALAAHPATARGRSVLVMGGLPSEPYAHMTLAMLQNFGVETSATGAEWRVAGPLIAPAEPIVIEADASAAAVALAAGCLAGQEVRVPGFQGQSSQGDLAILEQLRAFGCETSRAGDEIIANNKPTRAAQIDCTDTPDLAPVLAAVAGSVALGLGPGGPVSLLTGLDTLNGKECRRVEVLAAGLRALGLEVDETEHSLAIGPAQQTLPRIPAPLVLDPHGDHRMAFAFALLGLTRANLRLRDPRCVGKSWPDFWAAMGATNRLS